MRDKTSTDYKKCIGKLGKAESFRSEAKQTLDDFNAKLGTGDIEREFELDRQKAQLEEVFSKLQPLCESVEHSKREFEACCESFESLSDVIHACVQEVLSGDIRDDMEMFEILSYIGRFNETYDWLHSACILYGALGGGANAEKLKWKMQKYCILMAEKCKQLLDDVVKRGVLKEFEEKYKVLMGTIYDLLEAYLAKGKTDELKQYVKIAAENEIKRGDEPFSHWIDVIKTCDMSESWNVLGYDDILSHVLHVVKCAKGCRYIENSRILYDGIPAMCEEYRETITKLTKTSIGHLDDTLKDFVKKNGLECYAPSVRVFTFKTENGVQFLWYSTGTCVTIMNTSDCSTYLVSENVEVAKEMGNITCVGLFSVTQALENGCSRAFLSGEACLVVEYKREDDDASWRACLNIRPWNGGCVELAEHVQKLQYYALTLEWPIPKKPIIMSRRLFGNGLPLNLSSGSSSGHDVVKMVPLQDDRKREGNAETEHLYTTLWNSMKHVHPGVRHIQCIDALIETKIEQLKSEETRIRLENGRANLFRVLFPPPPSQRLTGQFSARWLVHGM